MLPIFFGLFLLASALQDSCGTGQISCSLPSQRSCKGIQASVGRKTEWLETSSTHLPCNEKFYWSFYIGDYSSPWDPVAWEKLVKYLYGTGGYPGVTDLEIYTVQYDSETGPDNAWLKMSYTYGGIKKKGLNAAVMNRQRCPAEFNKTHLCACPPPQQGCKCSVNGKACDCQIQKSDFGTDDCNCKCLNGCNPKWTISPSIEGINNLKFKLNVLESNIFPKLIEGTNKFGIPNWWGGLSRWCFPYTGWSRGHVVPCLQRGWLVHARVEIKAIGTSNMVSLLT